jgi:hypothetical protein
MNIRPAEPGNNTPYKSVSSPATQEKTRVSYNSHAKKFEPMGASETEQIEHMEEVEAQINRFPIPTDCTSQAFLKTIALPLKSTGERIESNTKEVKKFFSGNAASFSSFISSVAQAQRSI